MNKLLHITDKTQLNKDYDFENRNMKYRVAVRAVIFFNEKVAIEHVTKGYNGEFYMLPGGGVDFGESLAQAFERESKEEAGVEVSYEDTTELGEILETQYRPHKDTGLVQLNYGYSINYSGVIKDVELTETETEKEMELIWIELDEAIKLVSKGNDNDYTNFFTRKRDSHYLELCRNSQLV